MNHWVTSGHPTYPESKGVGSTATIDPPVVPSSLETFPGDPAGKVGAPHRGATRRGSCGKFPKRRLCRCPRSPCRRGGPGGRGCGAGACWSFRCLLGVIGWSPCQDRVSTVMNPIASHFEVEPRSGKMWSMWST